MSEGNHRTMPPKKRPGMEYCLGRFKYLVPRSSTARKRIPSAASTEESVVGHFGTKRDIISRHLIIVWSHRSYAYYVFESVENLRRFLEAQPKNDQHYSEVIFSKQPQKPHFDIDGGDEKSFKKVIKAIKEISAVRWSSFANDSLIVFECGTEEKFSRHIIINKSYPNAKIANEIVWKVVEKIGHGYIDESVYKKIQNFRLVGSSKVGGGIKRLLDTKGAEGVKSSLEDCLVGDYSS